MSLSGLASVVGVTQPAPPLSPFMLATVVSVSGTTAALTIDGAASPVTAKVGRDILNFLAAGARVICTKIGATVYVIDVLSGGMQRGVALITGTATANRSLVVNLDSSIFGGAAPSNVQLTPTASWSDVAHCYVVSTAANQFTAGARHVDNGAFSAATPVTVMWIAYV